MKIRKQLLFIAFLLGKIFLFAQNTTDVDSYGPRNYTIIPPSPEVASMTKNVDYPITPFNGQPDISFPIYTITEGLLSVPITVQYQSGGLKVDEQPGNLGLSWTLIVGGCVSRTVYGHPDEAGAKSNNIKGLFNNSIESNMLREFAKSTIADFDPSDYNYFMSHRTGDKTWGVDYYYGRADMANDILKVSCMNLSGTFIYNDDKDIEVSSPQPISISPDKISNSYPDEYIITDNNGTKYYFNTIERTKYEYYHGYPGSQLLDSMYYPSAWHLTKIKNLQNDSIIFHYKNKKKRLRNGPLVETYYKSSNPNLAYKLPDDYVVSCANITYNPVRLDAVESSSAIVRFIYDEDVSTERIKQITISTNNDNEIPIKDFKFLYNTFLNLEYDEGPQRTLLTQIIENNTDLYNFTYHTALGSENEIPYHPLDQDFCGYYNAAINNGIAPNYDGYSFYGSNRNVNPEVSYYGALKSIEYPTGGSTEFEWESHDYSYFNNQPVHGETITHTVVQQTDTLIALNPIKKLVINNYSVNSSDQYVIVDLSNYFKFNPQILLLSDFYGLCHEYASSINLHYPKVTFTNMQTGKTSDEHTIFIDSCTVLGDNKGQIKVYLDPNVTYRVELQYPTSITSYDGFDTQFLIEHEFMHADADCGKIFLRKSATANVGNSNTYKAYWGGLRIARIISKANNSNEPIIKGFYYGDPLCSTGVVSVKPDYAGKYYYITKNDETPGFESSEFYQISSNGLYNLPVGNIGVEYTQVNEWCSHQIEMEMGRCANTNSIQYNYSSNLTLDCRDFNNTQFIDFQPTSAQMWTSKAHHRGNLMNKQYCNYAGILGYINIDYEYNILEPEVEELSIFTTDLFRIADFNTAPVPNMNINGYDYSIGKYNLIPYNKTIKQEIYREHDYSDTTRFTYFYNNYTCNLDYNLLRSKIKIPSNGLSKETFYTYCNVNGTYLNIPETEVTVIDGKIVDAKRMEYNNRNLLIKSYGLGEKGKDVFQYNLGDKQANSDLFSLINQPEYSYEYDNHGNLIQISYKGEVLASYLWGYRGSYPIVEVENISYADLLSIVNGLGKNPEFFYSATGNTESDLSTFYTSLRNALPNHKITTMTYHWLIGVSSSTDSRGITTYFSFDNQGRLSSKKNYNDYFIRKYDYHYKPL